MWIQIIQIQILNGTPEKRVIICDLFINIYILVCHGRLIHDRRLQRNRKQILS
jgi:hypothetical protein